MYQRGEGKGEGGSKICEVFRAMFMGHVKKMMKLNGQTEGGH